MSVIQLITKIKTYKGDITYGRTKNQCIKPTKTTKTKYI